MNSTKDELDKLIDELVAETIEQAYQWYGCEAPHDVEYYDHTLPTAKTNIRNMFAERERLASQKAIDYFYWRIDCSTLISELEGWRGCIDMAKHQTEEHLSALQPSNKETIQ